MNPSVIVRQRRDNWHFLDRLLCHHPGYRRVFPRLPEGVCPLFLPVWVSRRATLVAELSRHGIEPFVFGAFAHPALPSEGFAETQILRDHILCLPVHQYLGEPELAYVAQVLGPLLVQHEFSPDSVFVRFARSP